MSLTSPGLTRVIDSDIEGRHIDPQTAPWKFWKFPSVHEEKQWSGYMPDSEGMIGFRWLPSQSKFVRVFSFDMKHPYSGWPV